MERVNKDKPSGVFNIVTEAWRNRVELVGRKRGMVYLKMEEITTCVDDNENHLEKRCG